eukprot:g20889.t1
MIVAYNDKDATPRDLQTWADAQCEVQMKPMQKMEFFDSVIHLGFSTFAQIRNYVNEQTAAAHRMKSYLLKGQACSPCDCGYYDFFKKVMEINELHDFHAQLAKVLVEGRGDRGSTLIILGPAGSGKTHFVSSPLTLILRDKCFVLPSGDGSYLLSAILERSVRLFVLDEVTLPRCQLLFGNERTKGWLKAWL